MNAPKLGRQCIPSFIIASHQEEEESLPLWKAIPPSHDTIFRPVATRTINQTSSQETVTSSQEYLQQGYIRNDSFASVTNSYKSDRENNPFDRGHVQFTNLDDIPRCTAKNITLKKKYFAKSIVTSESKHQPYEHIHYESSNFNDMPPPNSSLDAKRALLDRIRCERRELQTEMTFCKGNTFRNTQPERINSLKFAWMEQPRQTPSKCSITGCIHQSHEVDGVYPDITSSVHNLDEELAEEAHIFTTHLNNEAHDYEVLNIVASQDQQCPPDSISHKVSSATKLTSLDSSQQTNPLESHRNLACDCHHVTSRPVRPKAIRPLTISMHNNSNANSKPISSCVFDENIRPISNKIDELFVPINVEDNTCVGKILKKEEILPTHAPPRSYKENQRPPRRTLDSVKAPSQIINRPPARRLLAHGKQLSSISKNSESNEQSAELNSLTSHCQQPTRMSLLGKLSGASSTALHSKNKIDKARESEARFITQLNTVRNSKYTFARIVLEDENIESSEVSSTCT